MSTTPNPSQGTGYFDLPAIRPIRHLLMDPQVTEVMINGRSQVFAERQGRMLKEPITFETEEQLSFLVETLMRPSNRSVDNKHPYADGRLPDGSRVNVVLPPIALNGPTITIRKFTRTLNEVRDLIAVGTMTERMAALLVGAIRGKLNIVFSGATGSGKTTTLGILSRHIDPRERIILIEDTAELELHQDHVVRLECRQANVEGEGAIEIKHLVRNALRMRPTRIIVGEVRGDEAVEMLQAITSGHEGCLSVLHASSPRDAVTRLEMMVLSRGLRLPLWAIHRQIAAAIDLVIQHEILPDGSRRVSRITEVAGVEGEGTEARVKLNDLFAFQNDGPGEDGRIEGRFVCSGVEPQFIARFARYGVNAPSKLFEAGNA